MRSEMNTILWLSLVYTVWAHELPKDFQLCHLSDPKMDECLTKAITDAVQIIGSKGIPSLGFPSIDPLVIKEFHIDGEGAASFSQKYYDSKLYGYLQTKISNVHLDVDKKILAFTTFNNFTQHAHYNMSGQLLQLPISGDGDSKIQALGSTLVHTITFSEKIKKGETYWIVDNYKLKMSVTGATFEYENLFNGNKLLADNVLKVMNENWRDVADGLIGAMDQAYGIVMKAISNQLFEKVPISKIFPK